MGLDYTDIMRHKTDYLTPQEIETMLDFCVKNKRVRDYLLILTLQRTGRRVTEIVGQRPFTNKVGLRPCDIHPDGLIEFDILKKNPIQTKNKKGKLRQAAQLIKERLLKKPKRKLFPVDDQYLKLLQVYIKHHHIPTMARIFPISRQRVDMIIKDIAKQCKIERPKKKIHAHNFRHSFAVNLLKDNPNDGSILIHLQELLDHSNLSVTKTYAQFTPEDKREKLNKLFNKK